MIQRFDPNDANGIVCVQDVRQVLAGSFSVNPGAVAWSTAVLTVVYRNGGGVWTTYPGLSTLTSSATSSGRIDLSWVDQVALKITTAEGTSRIWSGSFNAHA